MAKIGSPLPIPPRHLPPSHGVDADKKPSGEKTGSSTLPPPMASTTQSFFDPTGMPGVLVLVMVACIVLTSMAWVIVIIWRRRRPSLQSGGVATVVVSLHENGSVASTPINFNAQRPPAAALPFDPSKHALVASTRTDTQSSVQLATVAFWGNGWLRVFYFGLLIWWVAIILLPFWMGRFRTWPDLVPFCRAHWSSRIRRLSHFSRFSLLIRMTTQNLTRGVFFLRKYANFLRGFRIISKHKSWQSPCFFLDCVLISERAGFLVASGN